MSSIDHGARGHALLSPSGASRWMNCTVSARLEEGVPSEGSSIFAEEGTLAHEFAELFIRDLIGDIDKKELAEKLTELRKHPLYYDEMESEVEVFSDYVYGEYVSAKQRNSSTMLIVEERVDLSHIIPQGSGMCDDIIISDGVMEVIDLKFGKGVKVSAIDNKQLKLYGLGALHKFGLSYDIHTVKLTIVQPRLDHIESDTIAADELERWGETEVKEKAAMAYAGEGEAIPGDHCRFCKVKSTCKALAIQRLKSARADFNEDDLTSVAFVKKDHLLMSKEEMVAIHKHSSDIQQWLDAISTHMLLTAIDGEEYPGYKLVAGRSVRSWSDPEKVIETLTKEGLSKDKFLSEPKLLGITAIEKVIGKNAFEAKLANYTVKPEGKPTLATIDDERPAIGPKKSAQEDFSDSDNDDL